MVKYLALRIERGALDYATVCAKFAYLREQIDAILARDGYIPDEK